jgi:hypothetical protein
VRSPSRIFVRQETEKAFDRRQPAVSSGDLDLAGSLSIVEELDDANVENTIAKAPEANRISSCPPSIPQQACADLAKTLAGFLKQLLGNRQIDDGGMEIAVTEIGPQVRQSGLDIDALPIPGQHPMDDKGVAQIMNARANAVGVRLQPSSAQDATQQMVRSDVGVAFFAMPEEMRIDGGTCAGQHSGVQVFSQCFHNTGLREVCET